MNVGHWAGAKFHIALRKTEHFARKAGKLAE
jgi:hypothetical protein